MDLTLWHQSSFTQNSLPTWRCPSCGRGVLNLVTERFRFEETYESRRLHEDEAWEPYWIKYTFIGYLECSYCHGHIAFCGDGNVDEFTEYDPEHDVAYPEYQNTFKPKFFIPPLPVFEIPSRCPDAIKEAIDDSFSLFWCDVTSCANKIRIVLELIMTDQKIPRFTYKAKKRLYIKLHKRIELYRIKNTEIADYLLAIKWIGNEGSHTKSLDRNDLLDAYQLLETSLNKLYDDKESNLKKISKEINKRRGTRKRK